MIQKVKNMVPLLVPLFISAFRRANDLAMAMEARCYHGGRLTRTQMKPLHYAKTGPRRISGIVRVPCRCDRIPRDGMVTG